ncbi:hypothetical protein CI102_731 [Trichoderma harzianum]|nr:hypothetical protein CI102_731 [Trichoderma harzianum]
MLKIAEGDYPPSPPATVSHSKSPSPEPGIKEMTDQQIPPDMGSVTKHAIRTLEGSASLTEAILAESVESITHAESPEPNRDISLDLFPQGNTTRNTMERDGYFPIRGSINPANQIVPMQTKDSWNGKERPALTWVEDGIRGESLTDGSRAKVPEGPPLVRIPYRRPTVEDYSHDDSSSPSTRSSSRSRRENRNGDSRSPSISRRLPPPPRYSSDSRSSSSPSISRRRLPSPLRRGNRSSDFSSPSIGRLRRRFSPPLFRRGNRRSDSRSPSPRRRFSPQFRRENRNGDSRSLSPRSRFYARFREENRNGDSRSPSLRRENSFDSERN